jgi:hypothetical protein
MFYERHLPDKVMKWLVKSRSNEGKGLDLRSIDRKVVTASRGF